jgi:dCMP deaminase
VRTVHAEQNAICQAAKRGVAIEGATLYCRMTPCRACAMMIINCGILRVVAERRYHDGAESEAMFAAAGVALEYVFDETERYENQ